MLEEKLIAAKQQQKKTTIDNNINNNKNKNKTKNMNVTWKLISANKINRHICLWSELNMESIVFIN